MQKHYPLLPPLKTDKAVAVLESTGTWENVQAIQLEHISRSLKVTTGDDKYTNIDSIPSMWARPLLFEMALYNADHPMHKCVLGEWRGLLAMLALKERKNFPLKTEEIKIPADNDAGVPEFLRALHKLLPEHTLEDNTTWDTLYLILFDGQPIGMTSPTTALCTAVDYADYLQDVPWYDGQFLGDPTSHLNPEERASIAGWLNSFHETQISPPPTLDVNSNPDLTNWIKLIKERFNEQILHFRNKLSNGKLVSDLNPKFSDRGLNMTHGIFRGMNYPIARKEYFTENLFVIEQKDAFTIKQGKGDSVKKSILFPKGSNGLKVEGKSVTPILPITTETLKEMLAKFSLTELNQRITFTDTGTHIKVSLRLRSSADDPESDFVTSQEYEYDPDEKKEDSDDKNEQSDEQLFKSYKAVVIPHVPVLEIWPNFRTPNWKAYYTYFQKAHQNTFYADPFSGDEAIPDSFKDMRVTKTRNFPEAMVCRYKDPNGSNHKEAGILLISTPTSLPKGDKSWNVGIDFGTSGTTVYRNDLQDQGGSSTPIEFDNRLFQITNSDLLRLTVYENFFSSRSETMPFFSLFKQNRNPDDKSENTEWLKPLEDGNIYFLQSHKLGQDVISNLKWSPEPIDRVRTRAFLDQICLQCAAEAVVNLANKINWGFSYPLAFSTNDRELFRRLWDSVTDDCTAATGIQKGDMISEAESVVTAKFFASKYGGFANGAVCIDIGGETSDISIWQQNTLCWQISLRLAGRHIFLDLLKHKPTFLKNFGVKTEDIRLLQEASESGNFYSQADAWIDKWTKSPEGSLQEKFVKYEKKIPKTFLQMIDIGISGLLYYVGLILKYLGEGKVLEKKMPNVYIGGNGSRILDWLANGNFGPHSQSNKDLKKIVSAASGFEDNFFQIQRTPDPKHEAAAGLVDDGTILKSTKRQFGVLAGEDFTAGEKSHDWKGLLTAELFSTHIHPNGLMQIDNFIEIFDNELGKEPGRRINIDEELKNKIIKDLNDELLDIHLRDLGERNIEPLFILGLKKLLEEQTKKWK